MTINEMRKNRNDLWGSMKNFLDTRRGSNGCLSAEDDEAYARMEADLASMSNEIEREERREQMEAKLNQPVSSPILTQPMNTGKDERKTGIASDEYKREFMNALRGRPAISDVMSVGTDADGGYLCPTEFEKQIISALEEENVMRRLCKVITTRNERKIPVAATHSVANWTAENAAYTESDPTFSQKTLDAHKLTDLVKVSIELMQDSMFDIASYVSGEFGRAFGIAEETAFCVGTGSGQPTGLFTANGGHVGVTAAATGAVTTDELISLIYSLKSAYRKNAKWLMNDATVSAVRKLKDGNGQYLWQPAIQAGQPDRLMGYELYTSPSVPTMAASAYAIAFGDFKNYWIADRAGRTVQRLNELYSTNGQVGFICTERVDAKIILPEGIQLLKMKA